MAEEDIDLRFRLAARLGRLGFGEAYRVERDLAARAWPPTGDHDRSIEGAIRALALAAGGHRPETSYTTKERIERDLDETFVVDHDEYTGDWIVLRPVKNCPKCHGFGTYREYERFAATPSPLDAGFEDATAIVAYKTIRCDHAIVS